MTSELLAHVRARAASIRASWEAGDDDVDELMITADDALDGGLEPGNWEDAPIAEPLAEIPGAGPKLEGSDGDLSRIEVPDGGGTRVPQSRDESVRNEGSNSSEVASELRASVSLHLPPGPERAASTPLIPYQTWSPASGVEDPRTAGVEELSRLIVDVVRVEGPVVGLRVYRLVNRAAGGQRLGKQSSHALNRASAAAIRRGWIDSANPLDQAGQAHLVLRLPGSPSVVVRERGTRELDELPPDEVAAFAHELAKRTPGVSRDQLKRLLLEGYGWQRLTPNVNATLERYFAAIPPI